jgi:hypothetical protein
MFVIDACAKNFTSENDRFEYFLIIPKCEQERGNTLCGKDIEVAFNRTAENVGSRNRGQQSKLHYLH